LYDINGDGMLTREVEILLMILFVNILQWNVD